MTASPNASYPAVKRAIDVVLGAFLAVCAAPLILIGCGAVWWDSGRPVIHRRRVVGLGGHEFDAFKIRTMIVNADEVGQSDSALNRALLESSKVIDDPRVTRVGRWLRTSSLDELPQLMNVIRGEMSLVGPRMFTAQELPAWHAVAESVLGVRPGITGLWQVSGRQSLSRDDRVRLDFEYVRRMSFALDLRILARTVPSVLSRRGAL